MRPLTFLCVRVYGNGKAKETVRDLEGLVNWLKYNRAYRPGNALFVNGLLVHPDDHGYLSEVECREVEAILLPDYEARCSHLVPESQTPQMECIGGRPYPYFDYAPEPYRSRFKFSKAA